MKFIKSIALLLAMEGTSAFTISQNISPRNVLPLHHETTQGQQPISSTALFMGRAAAVRAATKSKTDAKKAKTNAVYGKKIIMAVKQGGSPDPNSNRMIGDIIKQAKAHSA